MKLFAASNAAFARTFIVFLLFILFSFLFAQFAFAATTPFRSASIVTTDGVPSYTNLENCSVTDGKTCDRALASSYANLYFRDFGTYGDFGIPEGAKLTKLKIKVTGKVSNAIYVGETLGITFEFNCQFPSDRWKLIQLISDTIQTQTFIEDIPTINNGFEYCLQPYAFENKQILFRINYSSGQAWSANIDNFEIAFDYEPGVVPAPTPTPTPTPTATPTPTPTPIPGPAPFLDLPWDYGAKGLSFSEAALSINSYFDHEYPLLSGGLEEPFDASGSIRKYNGVPRNSDPYSSHDGYDYARLAKVNIGDSVFAAAGGIATYINSCIPCGNMILIDHENGYQTRYLHLQKEGLITNIPDEKVGVSAGQAIGKVGATGNVSPAGDVGAHIHFGVFEDKNKDGNFDDNVPDGVTDPFGWQSKDPDPWAIYTFFYNGQNRTGNKSYYLWKKKIDNLDATLTSNGAVFNTGRYKVDFPKDATDQNLNLNILSEPIVKLSQQIQSIGSTIAVTASDLLGNIVTSFPKLFNITVDFSSFDLTRYNTDTLSFYSSTDGVNWTKEPTTVDYSTNTAITQIDHLTHFALLAERKDTTAPTTIAVLGGEQGQQYWFRSDVSVSLNANDNEGGLGVDYTLYKIETNEHTTDWRTYKTPLIFTQEGHHKIEFYSVDNDENIESVKSVEFDIDKTPPEAKIQFDTNTKDLGISGSDNSGYATVSKIDLEKNKEQFIITDKAGNFLTFINKDREHGKETKLSLESLSYNNSPIINLNKNKFHIEYSLNKGKDALRELEQNLEIKKEIKIRIKYDSKKDKSTIITKVKGTEKIKEIREGLILLQLVTEKGTLNYSY